MLLEQTPPAQPSWLQPLTCAWLQALLAAVQVRLSSCALYGVLSAGAVPGDGQHADARWGHSHLPTGTWQPVCERIILYAGSPSVQTPSALSRLLVPVTTAEQDVLVTHILPHLGLTDLVALLCALTVS